MLSSIAHGCFIFTKTKKFLIYVKLNLKNVHEKAFSVLMIVVKNLQRAVAGKLKRTFKKNPEFLPQIY